MYLRMLCQFICVAVCVHECINMRVCMHNCMVVWVNVFSCMWCDKSRRIILNKEITILVSTSYRKMGNFRVVQFSRYFAVRRDPRKLKSAKYFPSLTI